MAEAARVGMALDADPRTFHGLAGIGDLLSALGGDARPELVVGELLAQGRTPEAAFKEVGANIEAAELAKRVAAFARSRGFEAPISEAGADVRSRDG